MNTKKTAIFSSLILIFTLFPAVVLAFATNGTIDPTYKYAWSEEIGWINFGCDNCNVSVVDSELTGRAWSESHGWINLDPSQAGVKNDGEGNLSGSAWGENLGYIDFSGVTINSDGYFEGFATGDITGQINFNCSNTNSCSSSDFKVRTDWRPQSARSDDDTTESQQSQSNSEGGNRPPPTSIGSGDVDRIVGIGAVSRGNLVDKSGVNFLAHINSEIYFNISGSATEHLAKITELNPTTGKVVIRISSNTSTISLSTEGESELVDIDQDLQKDMRVTYNELEINRIDLTFTKLSEGDTQTEETTTEKETSPTKDKPDYIQEGALVKEPNSPKVYLIKNGKKRHIPDPETFNNYGFSWDNIKEVDDLSIVKTGPKLPSKSETSDTDKQKSELKTTYEFTGSLEKGDTGKEVKKLQQFLNDNGFQLAESGPGSPGNETNYYGDLTKQAVIKLQNKYSEQILKPLGLSEGTGYFGSATIEFVNSFDSETNKRSKRQKNSTKEKISQNKEIETDSTSGFSKETAKISAEFDNNLKKGMKNQQVKRLQRLLATKPDIYPEGYTTGYFGSLTEAAVQKFQLKYSVVDSKSEPGYGYVGPKTRMTIKKVFGKK